MRSITTVAGWATAGTVAVVAAAAVGCGGGGVPAATAASPSPSAAGPSAVTPTPLMWPRPTVDPAIARWARAWNTKIERPVQHAAARLAANIGPALAGSAPAAFRLTPALNTLSNCRAPLDAGLGQPPAELAKARRRTIGACRAIYVGTDTVIAGLNSQRSATADAGIARVRRGVATLRRIGLDVKRAARPR